jgi:very-short-patch-repair endonuclease
VRSVPLGDASQWWTGIPTGRVTFLAGPSFDTVLVALDPLPATAPPVISYQPGSAAGDHQQVEMVLDAIEQAVLGLFPAWLPGAKGVLEPDDAAISVVRAQAFRIAAKSHHFGPFLADLAEAALRHHPIPAGAYAPMVRGAGLARVVADAYNRSTAVLLVDVPEGLTAGNEGRLASAVEWLAGQTGMAVWLTGAPMKTIDRFNSISLASDTLLQGRSGAGTISPQPTPSAPKGDKVGVPPIGGRPRADSAAETALENALSDHGWAKGRAWNQTYHVHPLALPYRLDLWWKAESCVVEIDGPEHCVPVRYAADRRRDVDLQLDGHVVMRYTNDQVLTDVHMVLAQIERMLTSRRTNKRKGQI